ncbi:hypothetical protein PR003_g8202 [Phytophthora rubi]|uniref:Uncharacterized protein n=1 Tax=Phytophthora rubi TaxID=129364 RepID=A0A6A4FW21_9STRA|nr:hypothetical protein PR003_g8202 [Phytophthora rubi]
MNSWMAWRCWLGVAELSSDVTTNSPDTAARRCSACHSTVVRWGNAVCSSVIAGATDGVPSLISNLVIGRTTKCYQV